MCCLPLHQANTTNALATTANANDVVDLLAKDTSIVNVLVDSLEDEVDDETTVSESRNVVVVAAGPSVIESRNVVVVVVTAGDGVLAVAVVVVVGAAVAAAILTTTPRLLTPVALDQAKPPPMLATRTR